MKKNEKNFEGILIEDLEVPASIGVTPQEHEAPTMLLVSVRAWVDIAAAAKSDAIEDTLDYARVCDDLRALGGSRQWNLLESLASKSADMLLLERKVRAVEVFVRKPGVVPHVRGACGVCVYRESHLICAAEERSIEEFIARERLICAEPPPELASWISKEHRSLRETLFDFIAADGRTEREIYEEAGLDRRRFSEIRSGGVKISKVVVVSLAYALKLTLDDLVELLQLAGYALSPNSTFDMIVKYYFWSGELDLCKINDALYTYHQPLVCGVVY